MGIIEALRRGVSNTPRQTATNSKAGPPTRGPLEGKNPRAVTPATRVPKLDEYRKWPSDPPPLPAPKGRLLAARVDALTVAFRTDVDAEIWAGLCAAKDRASKTEGAHAAVEVAGCSFAVSARGATTGYPIVMSNADATVLVSRDYERDSEGNMAGPGWCVEVQVRAVYLATHALSDVRRYARAIAEGIGKRGQNAHFGERVRRLDLAADVELDEGLSFGTYDRDAFVGRTKNVVDYRGGGLPPIELDRQTHETRTYWKKGETAQLTGFSFSQGGALSARLYDKSAELERYETEHEKPATERAIWSAGGWQGRRVWRLELQVRRETLAELEINVMADVERLADGLWMYGVTRWLRLVEADRTRLRRAAFDPRWVPFLDAVFTASSPAISRVRAKRGGVSRSQALGTVLSYLASLGSLPDPSEATSPDAYLVAVCADFAALVSRDTSPAQLAERAAALRARFSSEDDPKQVADAAAA